MNPTHPSGSSSDGKSAALLRLDLERVLGYMLDDYRDLQAPVCHTLHTPPTAIEALRMVHSAHPTLIKGYSPLTRPTSSANTSPDVHTQEQMNWDDPKTYKQILGSDTEISIAITDDGRADSVRYIHPPSPSPSLSQNTPSIPPEGCKAFIKPLEERMSVGSFLERLTDPQEKEVLYLQSQDGNIHRSTPGREELRGMREWVGRDVGWMKEGSGESAAAVNLWIGTERSSTSLHHDPYDNIYHVLSGTKTFTLISPIEGLWLDQRFFPSGTLHRSSPSSSTSTSTNTIDTGTSTAPTTTLIPLLDPNTEPIPWVESTIFPKPIQPIIVTLQPGETLFLPAYWWHAVDQVEGPGGVAVAVNYWYDLPIHPQQEALLQLAQRTARLAGRMGVVVADNDDVSDAYTDTDTGEPIGRGSGGGDGVNGTDDEGGAYENEIDDRDDDDEEDEDDDIDEEEENWDPTEWRRELARVKAEKRAEAVGAVRGVGAGTGAGAGVGSVERTGYK